MNFICRINNNFWFPIVKYLLLDFIQVRYADNFEGVDCKFQQLGWEITTLTRLSINHSRQTRLHKTRQLIFTGLHRQRLHISRSGSFIIVRRTFDTSSPLIPSETITSLKSAKFQLYSYILPDKNALPNIRLQYKTNKNDDSMQSIDKVCKVYGPWRRV